MRAITGMTEEPGGGDNPRIMHMADAIAREYPDQAEYCSYYTGDDVAWCGLTVGYCMTLAGIEPVYGETDTERWMWALAWADWPDADRLTEPVLGCIVVKEREGGGHVTLYESTEGGMYKCRGGNQSDMVNVTSIDPRDVVALMWPKGHKRPHVLPEADEENQAAWLQASLNIVLPKLEPKLDVDGEVGPATEGATKQFQKREGLMPTGKADRGTVGEIIHDLEAWNTHRPDKPLG
jgi:uncharacterized protein (TIGR02594 family)